VRWATASTRRSSRRSPAPDQPQPFASTFVIGTDLEGDNGGVLIAPARQIRRGFLALALIGAFACAAPAAEAAFPGKPGRIAFTTQPQGEYGDLFTVAPYTPGGEIKQLTQNTGGNGITDLESCPSWSPSGGLLTFMTTQDPFTPTVMRPSPNTGQWLIDPDGANRRVADQFPSSLGKCVRFDPNGSLCGTFSPDGSGHGLYYCGDPETGEKREVVMNELALAEFDSVAPSGRLYASVGADGSIYLNGGKRKRRLSDSGALALDPTFAPDGSAIAWIRETEPVLRGLVEVHDLRSGVTRQLTPAMDVRDISWRPIPVSCGGRDATQVGTRGRDVMVGGPGRDVLAGLGGRDTIRGGKGNDVICGGKGRDRLVGGPGRDRFIVARGDARRP
jgi:hypothetical protein